jgi:hypothetical protein
MTQEIGIFNLDIEDAKCDGAVKAAIIQKAKASAKWNDVPGNHKHYKPIEKVFNTILQGGTLEEVRAVFKAVQPPASLSRVGLVFPPVIWEKLGRGERIEAIDTDEGLVDIVDWQLENDMQVPEEGKVVTAWVAGCMVCGKEHTVRELTSTLYCEDCKPKRKGSKKGSNGDSLKRQINAFADRAIQMYSDNPEKLEVVAHQINRLRVQAGLKAMSKKTQDAGPKNWKI